MLFVNCKERKKLLYFERRGYGDYNGICCRIESVFKNDAGELVYMCASAWPLNKEQKKHYERSTGNQAADIAFSMNAGYCIMQGKYYRYKDFPDAEKKRYPDNGVEYTLPNICAWVNSITNSSFDEVMVLPELSGYSTRSDDNTKVNRGDTFRYQPRITRQREQKVEELKQLHKQQFPSLECRNDNTSYWIDDSGKLMVRLNVSDEEMAAAGYTKRTFAVEI